MNSLSATFQKALAQLGLTGAEPIVVAVSGGVDSVILLRLLAEQRPALRLVAAHLDHAQRKESKEDARFVARLCRRLNIPLHTGVLDEGRGLSEEAMRDRRREFLLQVAQLYGALAIATGHHADDRLETFLMRLLRGSGLSGLKSIRARSGQFVRPLLDVEKAELVAYAKRRRWTYRDDKSNLSAKYFRNRVRLRAVPVLEKLAEEYGGKSAWLSRVGDLLRELEEVDGVLSLESAARAKGLWEVTPAGHKLSLEKLFALEVFWRRRVLRLSFSEAGLPALTRRELEKLLVTLEKGRGKAQLSNGLDVQCSMGFAFFFPRASPRRPVEILQDDALPEGMELRAWRAGDRFRGKPVVDRLKKMGVPAPERSHHPVMVRKGTADVVWHPLLSNEPSLRIPYR